MLILSFIALTVGLAVGDLLDLKVHQSSSDLGINCTVCDPNGGNISHVISLVLSRATDTGESVLANIYSYDKSNPISHIQDGTVSGSLYDDPRSVSFLGITWKRINASHLDGHYSCEMNSLGLDMLPTFVKVSKQVKVKEVGLVVIPRPDIIQLGLTRDLEMTCLLEDPASVNLSTPISVSLSRVHGNSSQLLSSANALSPASLMSGVTDATVEGHVGTAQGNSSIYLKMSWTNPTERLKGEYVCEVMGTDYDGKPVLVKTSANVTAEEPPRQKLVDRIELMDKQLQEKSLQIDLKSQLLQQQTHQLQQQSQQLQLQSGQLQQQSQLLYQRTQEVQQLYDQLNKSAPCTPSVTRVSRCDDLNEKNITMVVTLDPLDNQGQVDVLCQFDPQGKGWTVFQNRFDGSVDFYRNFSDYENGFGNLTGEFWMGLRTLRRLVQNGDHELQVDMFSNTNISFTRKYPNFSIGPAPGYQLNVSGYYDMGFGLSYHSGHNFSTYDHDFNDCAKRYHGAFWYNGCWTVNLNGRWGDDVWNGVIGWVEIHDGGNEFWMKETRMKFSLKS